MFQDFKKNFFSFTGFAAFVGVAGATSAFVTMFVNTADSISVKWLIATVLVCSWLVVVLLKIIFNLQAGQDRQTSTRDEMTKSFNSLDVRHAHLLEAIGEVKKELESETVAITATCIPFEYQTAETCCLYLIQNPNFDGWWLAPGGHADLREDAYPDKIATEKCLAEAGLNVTLLPGPLTRAGDYASCEARVAAHFCYVLDLPQTSRCAKSRHHRRHYDLTYVAQVKAHLPGGHGALQTKAIVLRFDMTLEQLQKAMIDAVHPKGRKLDGHTPFPPDLPARAHAAMQVFMSHALLTQPTGGTQ